MLISYNLLYPYDTLFHHHELEKFIYDDRLVSQVLEEGDHNRDK